MKYTAKFFIQWASSLCFLLALSAQGQTVHIAHCMAGCPQVNSDMALDDNELLVRQLYAASINPRRGLADWQAYRVLADSVGVASLLPRRWYEDELVSASAGSAETPDNAPRFVQSVSADAEERNYQLNEIELLSEDQGRLVPMSSFAGTPYWSELNFLSNMAPLPFALRVGSWSRLDQAINALADRVGEVFIVSGPIQRADAGEGVASDPQAYFKIVATEEAASAFIFARDVQQHVRFCDQLSMLETVEEEAGLSLFPERSSGFDKTLNGELGCTPN